MSSDLYFLNAEKIFALPNGVRVASPRSTNSKDSMMIARAASRSLIKLAADSH